MTTTITDLGCPSGLAAAADAAADAAASLQCLGVAGQLRGSTLTFERLESSAGRQNRRAAQAALIS